MACVVVAFAEAEEDELASALTRLWEDPEVSAEDAAEVWALALPAVSGNLLESLRRGKSPTVAVPDISKCKSIQLQYMACLKEHQGQTDACKDISKAYLQCRMDKNLMAKQDLSELGFREVGDVRPPASTTRASERRREGFVAGVRD
eukprot:jgi/Astpho2/2700/Aster-x0121